MDRNQSGALGSLTLRVLTGRRAEMAALQRVLEAAPAYVPEAECPCELGYRETGEVKPPPPGLVSEIRVMEKPLRRGVRKLLPGPT